MTQKLMLLHLSDIHIKTASDERLSRAQSIASATYPRLPEVHTVAIVISGDIAYSGTADQYALAVTFIEQIKAQQPKVIVCLGMIPFKLLSLVSSGLRIRSIGIGTFPELDMLKMNVIPGVQFDALPDKQFVVVPMTHPCYKLNRSKRVISKLDAVHTEIELLQYVKKHYLN